MIVVGLSGWNHIASVAKMFEWKRTRCSIICAYPFVFGVDQIADWTRINQLISISHNFFYALLTVNRKATEEKIDTINADVKNKIQFYSFENVV